MNATDSRAPDADRRLAASCRGHQARCEKGRPGNKPWGRLESPIALVVQGFLLGALLMFTLHPFAEARPDDLPGAELRAQAEDIAFEGPQHPGNDRQFGARG